MQELDELDKQKALNQLLSKLQEAETSVIKEGAIYKEDFMRKLFGIVTTSQETIDYWGE